MKVASKDIYRHGYAQSKIYFSNPRIEKVIEYIKSATNFTDPILLDIGCGDGSFAKLIGTVVNAKEIYGTDISEIAGHEASENGVNFCKVDTDVTELPYSDNKFDIVYCGSLIELVIDSDRLLKEIHRVLSPNGIAIITNPNMGAWASRIALLFGKFPYYYRVSRSTEFGKLMIKPTKSASSGYIRLLTTSSMKFYLESFGFNLVKLIGASDSFLPKFARLIDLGLSKFPSFAFQNIWVIKK